MHAGSNEAMVVRAVIQLGNSLRKHVVAEGIETASQFAQLRDMGCRAGQGYHMSRPLKAVAVEGLLASTLNNVAHTALKTSFGLLTALH